MDKIILKLDETYYEGVLKLCNSIRPNILQLIEQDKLNEVSIYAHLSLNLISELQHCINYRKSVLLNFTSDIAHNLKEVTCFNCSDNCNIKTNEIIKQLEQEHYKINDLISRVHKISVPIFEVKDIQCQYMEVKLTMLEIITSVMEAVFIEEAILIPKIIDAQIKIHDKAEFLAI